MIFSIVSSMHIDHSIFTVLQSRWFAKYTHSTEGQQRPLHSCECWSASMMILSKKGVVETFDTLSSLLSSKT
jgi:hypothetical protein